MHYHQCSFSQLRFHVFKYYVSLRIWSVKTLLARVAQVLDSSASHPVFVSPLSWHFGPIRFARWTRRHVFGVEPRENEHNENAIKSRDQCTCPHWRTRDERVYIEYNVCPLGTDPDGRPSGLWGQGTSPALTGRPFRKWPGRGRRRIIRKKSMNFLLGGPISRAVGPLSKLKSPATSEDGQGHPEEWTRGDVTEVRLVRSGVYT